MLYAVFQLPVPASSISKFKVKGISNMVKNRKKRKR